MRSLSLRLLTVTGLSLFIMACQSDRATRPLAETVRTPGLTPAAAALVPADAEVVMSALDNPRGLALGPQGALYVAEAGRGPTSSACFGNPAACACEQRGQLVCYGPTGAVSRLWKGRQERVVTGLPSFANAAGRAGGPHDIAMLGIGSAHVTIGLEGSPFQRDVTSATYPEFAQLGTLVRVTPNGAWRIVADMAAYEKAANPDPRIFDSNPYGLLSLPGGVLVAEAGGNVILSVAANKEISTFAVMPQVPQANSGDAVPTTIAIGPDGAYYVGILSGAPFRDGAASVYRVAFGQTPTPFRTGFKAIIDIDFDALGNLYVLQHLTTAPPANPGLLIRVSADGAARDTLMKNLVRPTSIVVAPDGAIYLTNRGLTVGAGEVLRFRP